MNTETKHHIDAARQVLVGVVPNPTSQIDQITNALIYKFMDDMDQSAIKQGGDPSFFIKDLKNYAWTRLMDARIGNQERMNIYSEALVKFSESKQLPQLFREIFKSAFLPYRSPEVLGLFLKEINYFDYSHPEELGNAYEYLLSVMGSQGDAGQFRTPRHIIDFMVDAVDPTMQDKVLDPACGTGGFLVSAYKHILEQHDSKNDSKNKEKPLTPDQRKNLMGNFEGYDIDPGMVRIAQVNMYLHQFKNPKIYNYDTLSMEERWNDKFSVILANPPFMSPKGGVSTHSKFSIQSSRSEVLFVDYIMNHLRPNGRAGIIVPEGIIFQSGSSHKQLRKNLVEDGLYAVVSLPSGVFAPYSGVKTSILLFNNELAKKSDNILFIKILNDGFDLGAQRRPNDRNDLPHALKTLQAQSIAIQTGNENSLLQENSLFAWVVKKEKISETDDYNLSGDRYRVTTDYTNAKWPMLELGEVCDLESGSRDKGGAIDKGVYSIGGEQISKDNTIRFEKMKYISEVHFSEMRKGILSKGDVLMVKDGATTGKMGYWDFDYKAAVNEHVFIFRAKKQILPKYLYGVLISDSFQYELKPFIKGIIGGISLEIKKIKIPLPPLEIQEQIVKELDNYQNIIKAANQIIFTWKPNFIVDLKWDKVKFDDYIFFQEGPGIRNWQFTDSGIKLLNVKNIVKGQIDLNNSNKYISIEEFKTKYKHFLVEDGDIILASSGATYGKNGYFKDPGYKVMVNTSNIRLHSKDNKKIIQGYIKLILDSELFKIQIDKLVTGAAQPNFGPYHLKQVEIPLPPIEIQKQIVDRIESEHILVEGNKKLIEIYEQKTKDALAKLWEE